VPVGREDHRAPAGAAFVGGRRERLERVEEALRERLAGDQGSGEDQVVRRPADRVGGHVVLDRGDRARRLGGEKGVGGDPEQLADDAVGERDGEGHAVHVRRLEPRERLEGLGVHREHRMHLEVTDGRRLPDEERPPGPGRCPLHRRLDGSRPGGVAEGLVPRLAHLLGREVQVVDRRLLVATLGVEHDTPEVVSGELRVEALARLEADLAGVLTACREADHVRLGREDRADLVQGTVGGTIEGDAELLLVAPHALGQVWVGHSWLSSAGTADH
jgi:hypothetical protein